MATTPPELGTIVGSLKPRHGIALTRVYGVGPLFHRRATVPLLYVGGAGRLFRRR